MTQITGKNGTTQVVAYTTAAAATSSAVGTQTRQIRIVSNSACHYAIGTSPTAVVTDPLLPSLQVEYVSITPGQKVSAIRAATGGGITATDGSLWVTELSN